MALNGVNINYTTDLTFEGQIESMCVSMYVRMCIVCTEPAWQKPLLGPLIDNGPDQD